MRQKPIARIWGRRMFVHNLDVPPCRGPAPWTATGVGRMSYDWIPRAKTPVLNDLTSILVSTSLFMTMTSSPSWAQSAPASRVEPVIQECSNPNHPGFDARQMEAICDAAISMLAKQRQALIVDTHSHQDSITNLDAVVRLYKRTLRGERIQLGEDPGPDPGPGSEDFRGPNFKEMGTTGRRQDRMKASPANDDIRVGSIKLFCLESST